MNLDDDVDDIICYVKEGQDPNSQWKIALPASMLDKTVKWFHTVMGHPSEKRLWIMLQEWYYHPKLQYTIDRFKCSHCQKHKLSGRSYGLLPECEVCIAPWEQVAIDLIGPWTVKVNGCNVEFNALTCINTASNLVELVHVNNKTSLHIHNRFMQSWLAQYPQLTRCVQVSQTSE